MERGSGLVTFFRGIDGGGYGVVERRIWRWLLVGFGVCQSTGIKWGTGDRSDFFLKAFAWKAIEEMDRLARGTRVRPFAQLTLGERFPGYGRLQGVGIGRASSATPRSVHGAVLCCWPVAVGSEYHAEWP